MRLQSASAAILALLAATACSEGTPSEPELEAPVLLSVVPQGGAMDVDPTGPVVLEFDHAPMSGMEAYADLHLQDLTGPRVTGTWTRDSGGRRLTFTPADPLMPHTEYVVHIGGGMTGPEGMPVDLERHGPGLGGHWATDGMMGGGPGGGMGGGMGGHSDAGWRHPENGTWGMVFSFTTGDAP